MVLGSSRLSNYSTSMLLKLLDYSAELFLFQGTTVQVLSISRQKTQIYQHSTLILWSTPLLIDMLLRYNWYLKGYDNTEKIGIRFFKSKWRFISPNVCLVFIIKHVIHTFIAWIKLKQTFGRIQEQISENPRCSLLKNFHKLIKLLFSIFQQRKRWYTKCICIF